MFFVVIWSARYTAAFFGKGTLCVGAPKTEICMQKCISFQDSRFPPAHCMFYHTFFASSNDIQYEALYIAIVVSTSIRTYVQLFTDSKKSKITFEKMNRFEAGRSCAKFLAGLKLWRIFQLISLVWALFTTFCHISSWERDLHWKKSLVFLICIIILLSSCELRWCT